MTRSVELPKFVFMPPQDEENIPERRFRIILENARRFLNGEPLTNVADKARWY